ncbi:MAG: hypothetical protein IT494_04545 [Gammaproteobacteria bacterium]|nr:hypothetical protein [Gammaproteobacteria bacterium]
MTLETHRKYRILIIDENETDRELLTLSLRSQLPNVDVLQANSATEFATHLATGALDALIADAVIDWGSPFELADVARRRNGACAAILFTNAAQSVADDACIGRLIDLNLVKDSAGFLQLPKKLERVVAKQLELTQILSDHATAIGLESMPVPNFVLDSQGRLCTGNEAFEDLLHLPRYRYIGARIDQLFSAAGQAEAWVPALLAGDVEPGAITTDVSVRSDLAAVTGFRMVVWPLARDGSSGRHWSGILVTNQSLSPAEASLALAESATVPLQQALSHDLQQPLQIVIRQASWLIEKHGALLATDALESVRHIHASSLRMQEMLDGVTALYRIGQVPQRFDTVALDQVVRQALENLAVAIEDSAATVETGPLPTLTGNRGQLVQLFQNLIANGIKFCRDRLPRIKISAVTTEHGWRVRIEDNGIGIAAEDTLRIFELYQRLHSEDEFPGTGVGLALCKRIMESHGGKISVESAPGKGSVFLLDFGTTETTVQ